MGWSLTAILTFYSRWRTSSTGCPFASNLTSALRAALTSVNISGVGADLNILQSKEITLMTGSRLLCCLESILMFSSMGLRFAMRAWGSRSAERC